MRRNKLTQNRLKELLYYNPDTGIFTWRISKPGITKGAVAGCLNNGYINIMVDRLPYLAHRLAFLYMLGYFPENEVDHKHRNRSDNRWSKIREVSHSCNAQNIGNPCNNTSGVKGVYYLKSRCKWSAFIYINNKCKSLGNSVDFDEAVCTRLAAEQCLDWSSCDTNSPAFDYVERYICERRLKTRRKL